MWPDGSPGLGSGSVPANLPALRASTTCSCLPLMLLHTCCMLLTISLCSTAQLSPGLAQPRDATRTGMPLLQQGAAHCSWLGPPGIQLSLQELQAELHDKRCS